MNDIQLDSASHDVIINSDGDLILLNNDAEVATQTLKINLLTLQGEWFTNTALGIPYLQEILRKGVPQNFVDTIFQTATQNSYNIDTILNFESELSADRVYTVKQLTARTTDKEIVSITNMTTV